MADKKISALTGASTPLAGTEVLPIVQSGSTVKVSVANLTVGRAVATAGGSFTDNITQSTAAKGINFTANTPAAGMTSQLLNWYEEGTWTPTDQSGAGLTFTVDYAKYTRIGNIVTAMAYITFPATADTNSTSISLPFTASKYDIGTAGSTSGSATTVITIGGAARFSIRGANLTTLINATLSGAQVLLSVSYTV